MTQDMINALLRQSISATFAVSGILSAVTITVIYLAFKYEIKKMKEALKRHFKIMELPESTIGRILEDVFPSK